MRKDLLIANRNFIIKSQSGKITGMTKHHIQNVSSYGGEGVIIDGSGYIPPTRIATTNNTVTEFFLKTSKLEMPVKLINHDVSLRDGHNVTLLWGARENADTMYLLRLINHNTNNLYNMVNEETIRRFKFVGKKISLNFLQGLLLLLIPFGIFVLIFILIRNVVIKSKTKRVIKELSNETTKIITEFKSEFAEKIRMVELA